MFCYKKNNKEKGNNKGKNIYKKFLYKICNLKHLNGSYFVITFDILKGFIYYTEFQPTFYKLFCNHFSIHMVSNHVIRDLTILSSTNEISNLFDC